MLKKLLTVMLVLVGLALIGLVCWGLTLYYQWTPWLGLALFLGVVGIALAIKYFRRIYTSTRGRLTRAMKPMPQAAEADKALSRKVDIKGQWTRAVDTLSKSSLRKRGNPLYILPWYLVMGNRGSGKTSALTRAHLSSPIKEVNSIASSGAKTTTWDWWFFDNSVMIDTAGRYAVSAPEENVSGEWQELLRLLAKSRRKEPLNGLIIAVPADQILYGSREALMEDGRQIRGRIDQLMRLFEARIPIYVMVTKCDLLYGMDVWSKSLPEKALQQAMGYVGEAGPATPTEFLDRAFQGVVERLRELRLHLLQGEDSVVAGMLLPNEFDRLRPGLDSFFSGAFGDSPYMETPFLRGLFFSSARQQGGVTSFVLKDSGLPEQTTQLSGTNNGFFLHDLLGTVIPRDRYLVTPLGRMRRWRDATRNLGVASWIVLAAAAAIFLTLSFTRTLNTLSELKTHQPESTTFTGKFAPDLGTLSEYHQMVKWLETRESSWISSFAPFHEHVDSLERQLKTAFAGRFQKYALSSLDQQTARRIRPLAQNDLENVRTHYIQFIVRRLNLLNSRAANANAETLYAMPPPTRSGRTLAIIQGDIDASDISLEAANSFSAMYVSYLLWQKQSAALKLESNTLTRWLNQFALHSNNLSWLADWANEQTSLSPVTLQEFWPGTRALDQAPTIQPAYTARGRAAIERFLKEVQASTQSNVEMPNKIEEFSRWYLTQRLDAWREFTANFELGKSTLDGEKEWKALLPKVASDINPYVNLLTRLASEFDDVRDDKLAPDWLKLARRVSTARLLSEKSGVLGSAERIANVIESSGQQIVRSTVEAGPLKGGKAVIDKQLQAANAYTAYRAALAKAVKEEASGRAQAFKVAADFHAFGVDPETKESLLHGANAALSELFGKIEQESSDNQIIMSILSGPLDLAIEYADYQAACHIQKEWEAKVLMPAQSAGASIDINDLLYGPKGILWSFAESITKPFLRRNASRYEMVETLGHSVPLSSLLPVLLNDGLSKRANQLAAQENAQLEQKQVQIQAQMKQLTERQKQQEGQRKQQEIEKNKSGVQTRLKEATQAIEDRKKELDALRAQVFTVVINAVPTSVNNDARVRPHSTVLTVQCASGLSTLTNFNFPVSETVRWSELNCGDTTVAIKIENLTLTHKYPGAKGFSRFLDDFYDGKRVFTPADFPVEKLRLEQLSVDNIRVLYEFVGVEAVRKNLIDIARITKRLQALQNERQALLTQSEKLEQQLFEERQSTLMEQARDIGKQQDVLEEQAGDVRDKQDQTGRFVTGPAPVPAKIAACWEPVKIVVRTPPEPKPPKLAEKTAPKTVPLAEKTAPKTVPAPVGLPPLGGLYFVQVGVFGPTHAVSVREKLIQLGIVHDQTIVDGKGGTLIRMRVGPYATREEAEPMVRRINETFAVSSIIVRM